MIVIPITTIFELINPRTIMNRVLYQMRCYPIFVNIIMFFLGGYDGPEGAPVEVDYNMSMSGYNPVFNWHSFSTLLFLYISPLL